MSLSPLVCPFACESINRLLADALLAEAEAKEPTAYRVDERSFGLEPPHSLLTSRSTYRQCSGDALQDFHEGVVREWASSVCGDSLFPTRCSYVFLADQDSIGIHQDTPHCEFTVVLLLIGNRPLLTLVDGSTISLDDLLAASVAADGHPEMGEGFTLNTNRLFAFRGNRDAHYLSFGSPCLLATFCFAGLVAQNK